MTTQRVEEAKILRDLKRIICQRATALRFGENYLIEELDAERRHLEEEMENIVGVM